MQKKRGLLITFEGTEGAGKSTLIQAIKERLTREGHTIVETREPGGSPLSEKIRDLILHQEMDRWTELFLYEASRAEHVVQTIRPALERGEIVLCDRFADSSLAYQSVARGLPWKTVGILNRLATQGIAPDLTVLMDVDPKIGLKKANDRNRFEEEGVKFHEKVRKGFLKAKKEDPSRWLVLKSFSADPKVLAEQVFKELKERKLLKVKA